MLKFFYRSLTTVVRAPNDTSKTANITDTIFDRKSGNTIALLLFRRFAVKYYHLFPSKMVSSDICCFRGVILSHYRCS